MEMKTNEKPQGLKKNRISTALIEEEYMTHLDDEDDEMYWTKEALRDVLTPYQRKIFITWVENGTYAAAARAFGVSTPTVKAYINELKAKISEYICTHI